MNIYEKTSALLTYLASECKVGVYLDEIDHLAQDKMIELGVESTDYLYQPDWKFTVMKGGKPTTMTPPAFPKHICTSVNDVICHGIPYHYALKSGDLICIDVGIRDLDTGLCGDSALTVGVGELENKNERLLRYAKRTLYAGISVVRDGVRVTEIGNAIQRYAWQMGYKVNRAFSGHRIDRDMHLQPFIPHFSSCDPKYEEDFDGILTEGMVICIEPMVTLSKDDVGGILEDGWTYITRDHKNTAMFEHMVRVEKDGFTILTNHINEN